MERFQPSQTGTLLHGYQPRQLMRIGSFKFTPAPQGFGGSLRRLLVEIWAHAGQEKILFAAEQFRPNPILDPFRGRFRVYKSHANEKGKAQDLAQY